MTHWVLPSLWGFLNFCHFTNKGKVRKEEADRKRGVTGKGGYTMKGPYRPFAHFGTIRQMSTGLGDVEVGV